MISVKYVWTKQLGRLIHLLVEDRIRIYNRRYEPLHFIIRAFSEDPSSGSKGPLDFFVRNFRFRPAARASEGRRVEKKEKKSKRPGRPLHLPRICRATDFFVRCITPPPVGGQRLVARRRGWEPLNRGVPVVPLVECGLARCVHVHIGVCTHITHTHTHTRTKKHIQTNA